MTTITAEGRKIRSNIVTGVVSILAIMVALFVVSAFGSDEAIDGPAGSSFVTTSLGTAGLHEMLEEQRQGWIRGSTRARRCGSFDQRERQGNPDRVSLRRHTTL